MNVSAPVCSDGLAWRRILTVGSRRRSSWIPCTSVGETDPFVADNPRPVTELAWASLLHFWNDGLTAALTLLLPYIAVDLHLGYAQAASLRTAHLLVLSAAQIPIAAFASAAREIAALGGSLTWFGASYIGLGAAMTFVGALIWVAVAGAGAGTYHPVATNRIAHIADPRSRGRALGTLNFSGDVGKFLLPAVAGAIAGLAGWRWSLGLLGCVAALVGIAYVVARRARTVRIPLREDGTQERKLVHTPTAHWGIQHPWPFALTTAIGVIDNSVRSAVLTFLPFLLVARGFGKAEVGGLFALMLIGGGIGKFVCGWLTDVVGQRLVIIVTEILMAAGTVGLLWVEGAAPLAIYLVGLGVALNGTSSAVLAGVADTVDHSPGSRGYSVYFTGIFAGGAIVPAVYGVLADHGGLPAVFWGLGLLTLFVPLLAILLPDLRSLAVHKTVRRPPSSD